MSKKLFAALALCATLCTCAFAAFPDKPITVICNYGAGGGTDLITRSLAAKVEKILGVPVNVINKVGGSGTLGIIETKKQKNDGYTIGVLTLAPLAIVPHQIKVPYVPEDFDYICAFGQYGYGLIVKADSPYMTTKDLVEEARKTPGGLGFSASGYPQPFAMADIAEKEGVRFNYIPVQSGAEAATAVIGGHVKCSLITQSDAIPYVKSGQVRLLASASNMRWADAPDVSTLQEQGYDTALVSYLGLGVPKGVPADRLAILIEAFKKALDDEEITVVMKRLNIPKTYAPGEVFAKTASEKYIEYGEKLKDAKK